MDFEFTPEEKVFRKEVRAFLEKEVTPKWDLANMFFIAHVGAALTTGECVAQLK